MFDFRLTENMNPKNAAKVADHLRKPRLWIPTEQDYGSKQHNDWLEKTEAELIDGQRHALLATLGRAAAGVIVFRVDPEDPEIIGIRNLSINPDFGDRGIGEFVLRSAERLAQEIYPAVTKAVIDTKATNHDMLAFLESRHYSVEEVVDLYKSGKPDVVLAKHLRPRDEAVAPQPTADPSTR